MDPIRDQIVRGSAFAHPTPQPLREGGQMDPIRDQIVRGTAFAHPTPES
ncbi:MULTISPECIES: hypothetical protein [unclassified Moorena]|nr:MULTISPECIES: hypothetical protein [unclassified Moorena]NEO17648.1 hypothetical protein [Moorena sp. SIO3E8]NEO45320.1 hypothetical protein [Moorena sp. SIO4A3]NEQ04264.1 hypothetical protein [Moorena sp. SIO3F7]